MLRSILLVAGLAVLSQPAAAQWYTQLSGTLGAGTALFRSRAPMAADPSVPSQYVTTDLQTTNAVMLHLSVGLTYDAPLHRFSDDMAAGLSLGASAGLLSSQKIEGLNQAFIFDFPGYLTWRYGLRATKQSTKPTGFGLGLGYRYAYTALPYHSPSLMAEASFDESWFLRLAADLRKTQFYNHYSSEGLVPVMSLRQVMLQVGYTY